MKATEVIGCAGMCLVSASWLGLLGYAWMMLPWQEARPATLIWLFLSGGAAVKMAVDIDAAP